MVSSMPSGAFMLIIVLLISYELFDGFMFSLPVRLLENAVCNRSYSHPVPQQDIDESRCKSAEIQAHVAFVRGYYSLFRTGPAIFVGPYFGSLADRYGRRPVYIIALIGLLLQLGSFYIVCSRWTTFPPEVSWVTGLFIVLGGGQFVLVGLNLTMVADVSAPNTRDRKLYIAFAVRYCAALVSPQIVAAALDHSLWLATLLAASCLLGSLMIIVVMRETLKPLGEHETARDTSKNADHATMSLLRPVSRSWPILLTLCVNFCLQFRMLIQAILVSYISVRFERTISQATRLMSIQPAVNLALFLILPAIVKAKSHVADEQKRGFRIFRWMMAMLCLGDVGLALAPTLLWITLGLAISAMGDGIRAPLLVIASSYIDQETETGRLYTLFAFTDALSHTVGDPFLQSVWRLGLHLQSNWMTLPIWVTLFFTILAYGMSKALPRGLPNTATAGDDRAQASESLLSEHVQDNHREDPN